ncbi:YIP1 family protein [Jannaschia sp. LMIT008]|uniref:YIP1 family protein n=1 Tax=Jannaschia maritima TaxID=3032585 RepID=UPI002810DE02|nr:YIP1 family protein [Jannaschia sp. LMIT008]
MAVTTDIPRAWIRPARVMRERLAGGADEKVAFVYVAAASVLGFVAQLPALVRRAREPDPTLDAAIAAEAGSGRILTVPSELADAKFEALVSSALAGWIFFVPLLLYVVAQLTHWIARLFGGRGTAARARHALFWSFLCTMPLMLLAGLTTGFVGPGIQSTIVGVATLSLFAWIWSQSLYVAETPDA